MHNFFARNVPYDSGLELFGGLHIALSAVFLLLCALVIAFRFKLKRLGHFVTIRRCMAAILFANMLIHYTGRIAIGEWRLSEDLPLHICFVTNFLMMYILVSDNRRGLFSIVYYFTLIGPLPAIIFPDLSRTWSGFLFWQFVISHHVMLLFSLYCAFVLGYETTPKHAVFAFLIGNAYVAAMAVFNRFFETNYIMLGGLPERVCAAIPLLRALPAVVWLEVAGVAAVAVAYAIVRATMRE